MRRCFGKSQAAIGCVVTCDGLGAAGAKGSRGCPGGTTAGPAGQGYGAALGGPQQVPQRSNYTEGGDAGDPLQVAGESSVERQERVGRRPEDGVPHVVAITSVRVPTLDHLGEDQRERDPHAEADGADFEQAVQAALAAGARDAESGREVLSIQGRSFLPKQVE